MEDKKIMKIITKEGLEKEYSIICAFYLPLTDKNYIAYTDETENKTEEMNLYVAVYYPNDDTRLDEITDSEEWETVNDIVKTFLEENQNNDSRND